MLNTADLVDEFIRLQRAPALDPPGAERKELLRRALILAQRAQALPREAAAAVRGRRVHLLDGEATRSGWSVAQTEDGIELLLDEPASLSHDLICIAESPRGAIAFRAQRLSGEGRVFRLKVAPTDAAAATGWAGAA